MDNVPQIFISATAADLESTRGAVKLAVVDAGCLITEQKELPFDDRQVRSALKERIQNCDAVVALVGFAYGPEPNAMLSERRRSCAQMEHDLAIELQKPLFIFLFAFGYPFDAHNHTESDELRRLQEAHRDQVMRSGRQYATVENEKEFQLKLKDMALFLARVKAAQDQRSASARFAIKAIAAAIVIGLILVGGAGALAWPYVKAYMDRPVVIAAPVAPAPPPAVAAEPPAKEPPATPVPPPKEAVVVAPAPKVAAPAPAPAVAAAPKPAASAPVVVRTPEESRTPPAPPAAQTPVAAAPAAVPAVAPSAPTSPPAKPAATVVVAPAPAPPTPPAPVVPAPTPAVATTTAPASPARAAAPPVAAAADGPFTHTVEKGDTLWDIAQQYGTTIKRLQLFNKNLKPTNLKIGAEIRIPGQMEADPPSDGIEPKEEPAKSKRGRKGQ